MANNDGAGRIVNTLRNYFAPDTADPRNQEVVRFLQFRRMGRTLDGHIVEIELRMHVSAGSPEASVTVLRMQTAAPSPRDKSLVLASTQKSLAFSDVATTICRLFGSCGGAARQDILVAKDVDEALGSDKDQEARETDSNANKRA